jgi:hypothetical protein
MIQFQKPCNGSTKQLTKATGAEVWPVWTREYTRFALAGIQVIRIAVK